MAKHAITPFATLLVLNVKTFVRFPFETKGTLFSASTPPSPWVRDSGEGRRVKDREGPVFELFTVDLQT